MFTIFWSPCASPASRRHRGCRPCVACVGPAGARRPRCREPAATAHRRASEVRARQPLSRPTKACLLDSGFSSTTASSSSSVTCRWTTRWVPTTACVNTTSFHTSASTSTCPGAFLRGRFGYRDFNYGDSFDGRGDEPIDGDLDRGYYSFDTRRYNAAYNKKVLGADPRRTSTSSSRAAAI